MARLSRLLLNLLTASFIISVGCLLIAYIGNPDSWTSKLFGGVGFYGFIMTGGIFSLHLLVALLAFILKEKE